MVASRKRQIIQNAIISSDYFSGKKPVQMSMIYNRTYSEATYNVGNTTTNMMKPDDSSFWNIISTIRIVSIRVRSLNGTYIPSFNNYVVPGLTSIASTSTKCFHYNITGPERPYRSIWFEMEFYKIGECAIHGFLILSNQVRTSGEGSFKKFTQFIASNFTRE